MALMKDPSLLAVLDRLNEDLGDEAFAIVDHWDADLCAVGVAKPSDHARLVYISTWPPADHVLAASLMWRSLSPKGDEQLGPCVHSVAGARSLTTTVPALLPQRGWRATPLGRHGLEVLGLGVRRGDGALGGHGLVVHAQVPSRVPSRGGATPRTMGSCRTRLHSAAMGEGTSCPSPST
jgi:hypothetical protein